MSWTKIKTYIVRPKDGSKCYAKDTAEDNALGFLKTSAFVKTTAEEHQDSYMQDSYEAEVNFFVERLLDGISTVFDEDGEIESYIFEDENKFDERHLLWACFDMLIKADLTIKELKKSRMEMVGKLIEIDTESEVNDDGKQGTGI